MCVCGSPSPGVAMRDLISGVTLALLTYYVPTCMAVSVTMPVWGWWFEGLLLLLLLLLQGGAAHDGIMSSPAGRQAQDGRTAHKIACGTRRVPGAKSALCRACFPACPKVHNSSTSCTRADAAGWGLGDRQDWGHGQSTTSPLYPQVLAR